MMKQRVVKTVAVLIAMTMGLAGVVHTASASVVGTRAVMVQAERAASVARVQATFDRDDMRAQLEAQGVDPAAALERVAALTDEELRYLDGRLAELPAGADVVAVVGVVFIVLLILELVGVTDIFKSF